MSPRLTIQRSFKDIQLYKFIAVIKIKKQFAIWGG